jgi:hypothetical protein
VTPGERWRYAQTYLTRAHSALRDAQEAVQEAEEEFHLARFLYVAASAECPTCGAAPWAYCALFQAPDGTYTWDAGHPAPLRLVALGLHPDRTTTPEALAAASAD